MKAFIPAGIFALLATILTFAAGAPATPIPQDCPPCTTSLQDVNRDCECLGSGSKLKLSASSQGDCAEEDPCGFIFTIDLGSFHDCQTVRMDIYDEEIGDCDTTTACSATLDERIIKFVDSSRNHQLREITVACGLRRCVEIYVDGCLFWDGVVACEECE
jgi:hypothetical protein